PPHFLLPFLPDSYAHMYLHSFPTRRSSDLVFWSEGELQAELGGEGNAHRSAQPKEISQGSCGSAQLAQALDGLRTPAGALGDFLDRKSTRLNSSHVSISYAVFCLKKKIKNV